MTFGGFERGAAPSQPMAEINVTPLVDVMLVLLVVFIITAPLLTFAIKLELPRERSPAVAIGTPAVDLSIDAGGRMTWDRETIDVQQLQDRLAQVARRVPQPELHLRADRSARYEGIAMVMAAAQRAGLTRIGFVTEPSP
ncbi:MAG TPA: biopolymer transporter ExbD [Burkholderiaceae bacterium]